MEILSPSRLERLKEICKLSAFTIVRVGADWCPNSGIVDQVISRAWPPFTQLCEVDVDMSPEIVREFKIDSVPVVLILDQFGEVIIKVQRDTLSESVIQDICKGNI